MSTAVDIIPPLLGTILADIIWFVSIPVVLEARNKQNLGDINPLPYVAGLANCISWTVYSALIQDYYVFMANFPGVILCAFYSVTSMTLLAKQNDEKSNAKLALVEKLFMVVISLSTFFALVNGVIVHDYGTNDDIIGSVALAANVIYWASPCSNLYSVIMTRDASSLYLPMLLANLGCATCWFFYGIVELNDVFIYLPNMFGILFSVTGIITKLVIGDRPQGQTDTMSLSKNTDIGGDSNSAL